ncbi:hypothetical protein EG328_000030 [Venturia inaequalis]|uniref:Uncharacterized protein n=1 Tax=Venturia inaequalis TaxID=5025 RepID=A0A8H3VHB6_VENIN|nr:hypothetical protein EG328_000030 [Venturia inaequalis]RDI90015.1 hypothetical protein Vi05172_g65 [Venturia inaequalis]
MNFRIMQKMKLVFLLPAIHIPAFLFCVSNLSSEAPEKRRAAWCFLAILVVEGLVAGVVAGAVGAHKGLGLGREKKSMDVKSLNTEKKKRPSAPVSTTTTTPTVRNESSPKSILKGKKTVAGSEIEKKVRFKLSHEEIYVDLAEAKCDSAVNAILQHLNLDELCEYLAWANNLSTTESKAILRKPTLRKLAMEPAARKPSIVQCIAIITQNLGIQHIDIQNLSTQHITLENIGIENFTLENITLEYITLENITLEYITLENISIENISIESISPIGTQEFAERGAHRLHRLGAEISSIGTQEIAGRGADSLHRLGGEISQFDAHEDVEEGADRLHKLAREMTA